MAKFSPKEEEFLREAARHLEFPSFLTRATNVLGKPIERGIDALPDKARDLIEKASRHAIEGALKAALTTIPAKRADLAFEDAVRASERKGGFHLAGSVVTGAVGGFFGLPALAAELPISTGIMLRSIADTAADFGEDLSRPEVQLECLTVFSMGGRSSKDDEMDSAYFTSRVGLGRLIEGAAAFVAGRTAKEILKAVQAGAAPKLIDLIVKIASRFQIVVSEKAVGQLLPGIGAGAGALLNVAFGDYFNSVARYHFGLKRLEREHGRAAVERYYQDARLKILRGKIK